jgi:hypothetical protein
VLFPRSVPARFSISKQRVGLYCVPTRAGTSQDCSQAHKEVTRKCTEGKAGTGASRKKPAGSSRERTGTVGRKLSHVATGLGRDVLVEQLKKEQPSD